MDDAEWLAARRTGLGSSDAAAACGVKSFNRTPLTVYLEKLNLLPPQQESEEMESGHDLEPLIARRYERRTGTRLVIPEPRLFRHDLHPWMLATPDRFDSEHTLVVELKSAWRSEGWGPEGTDEIPEGYLLQVQHQLAVLDLPRADVAALVCGRLRVYHVARNDELIAQLVRIEGDLWQRILDRRSPPFDFTHPATPRLLDWLYRPVDEAEVTLSDPDALADVRLYEELGPRVRDLARRREEARARITARMGAAALARLPDGRRVRRTLIPAKEITYTRKPSVRFTLTGMTEEEDG